MMWIPGYVLLGLSNLDFASINLVSVVEEEEAGDAKVVVYYDV